MKATRDSFGEEIVMLGEQDSRVVVLDADLSKSTKSEHFAKKFPERFFQMGIAEANMIGTAAGLAMSGKVAFACSFGAFLTGRYDQIRMSVAYNRANVKLIGTHAGVAIGEDGHSQMGLEDVALLRSLPHFQIYQPSDDVEAREMLRFSLTQSDPAYFRLTRQKMPIIHSPDFKYRFGKWDVVQNGSGILYFGSGQLVHSGIEAQAALPTKMTIVNASTLKPVDEELICKLARTHQLVVTAEDHYVTGGLGSAVAEVLAENGIATPLRRIGVRDFGESGTETEVYRHFKLDAAGVAEQIKFFVSSKAA
jgi:transketolase